MNNSNIVNSLESLKELVERFSNNIEVYKSSRYDEENTKIDFIDKFFPLLGWDVCNASGASEDFREVIREDKVIIEGRPKSPDYCFKIGKERQFFVEAKKPNVNIYYDSKPAFQLRRYAYTAGLPISIITDFEEFSIYDTSVKPNENDNAAVARIFYCKYTEYEKHWDFLNETISKQAVWQGKLKKYSADNTKKKGTQTVDKELLKLIETWRFELAKNIALRNKELDIYQLNEAVQITIDRIIFLRMAEDRNTEVYGYLQKIIPEKEIYKSLVKYFSISNKKYNSGLFAPKPWLDNLVIDDKILKAIINDLYYPMPYEFSVLPIEILGQIYEQFLGKTITLSNRHVASVEEKPEVRKAGGVYYTPKYIVDYIVENTVGKKIENKVPKDIETLTILDPACGSGSFLVGAFKFLLSYHQDYYTQPDNLKKALKESRIYSAGKDDYRLTIREKKKILLNNIYGVDIDYQAVEVTKLSLLLTLMEGEIVESRGELFLKSISEALLPNLDNNIKCGNSLIGNDFYAQMNMEELSEDYQRKINCFDWEEEFPHIFKGKIEKFDKEYFSKNLKDAVEKSKEAIEISKSASEKVNYVYDYARKFDIVSEPKAEYYARGGFDIVIGNPPYGADMNEKIKDYYSLKFKNQNYQLDSYMVFLEQSLSKFVSSNGFFGMIIPNPWINNILQKKLRKFIINNTCIKQLVHFDEKVFSQATVDTEIVIIQNSSPYNNVVSIFHIKKGMDIQEDNRIIIQKNQQDWINLDGESINIFFNTIEKSLFDKIKIKTALLNNFFKINVGIKPYQVGKGKPPQNREIVTKRIFDSKQKIDNLYRQYLRGKDINRYIISPLEFRYIKYGIWLAEPRPAAHFDSEFKLLMRQTGDSLICAFDNNQFLCLNNMHVLVPLNKKDYYIFYFLGIINSKLLNWYYQCLNPEKGEALAEVKKYNVEQLPIKLINFSDTTEKAQHDRMVQLVEQMLEAQKKAHDGKSITETDKKLINQRINILDKQIDALVYELYGLTEDEIKIVEGE